MPTPHCADKARDQAWPVGPTGYDRISYVYVEWVSRIVILGFEFAISFVALKLIETMLAVKLYQPKSFNEGAGQSICFCLSLIEVAAESHC